VSHRDRAVLLWVISHLSPCLLRPACVVRGDRRYAWIAARVWNVMSLPRLGGWCERLE